MAKTLADKTFIKEFENVLKASKVDFRKYSLEGYQEDAVCLQTAPMRGYVVYDGFRNKHEDEKYFLSVLEAIFHMMHRLTHDETEIAKMQNALLMNLAKRVARNQARTQKRNGFYVTTTTKKAREVV